jgi:hypothetical protein
MATIVEALDPIGSAGESARGQVTMMVPRYATVSTDTQPKLGGVIPQSCLFDPCGKCSLDLGAEVPLVLP